jgi:hypothetical protein
MNIAKFNNKNTSNSRIIYLKHYLYLSLLKEEEENLINKIKKERFANKISVTELDLSKKESRLKQFNSKHNSFNKKILNQIQTISKKVYDKSPQDKRHEMLHNILFIKPKKEININNNNSPNKKIKLNSLNKISSPKRKYLNIKKKEDNIKENISTPDKKYMNEIKTEKRGIILPPINRFKYNVKKLKLNINNDLNKSEEEKMMNLYKELEIQNKFKFVV